MEVAIYLRKSRAEELTDTVEETLRRHHEILTEYAVKNDLNVVRTYEEVVSGESLYARPKMMELLSDVEQGKYEAVLCMDIDRLGRGTMSDQGIILETFKAADTKIITPRKVYDLNNELDEEYTEFETFMARRELKLIKRRMQRGVRKSIEEGGYLANAPYGYRNVMVNKRPTLEINEEEAKFVRLMFDLYVNNGMGCQVIADTVNAMGAKPHRSDRFGRTSVMHILRNYTFIGKIVWDQKTHIRKNTRGNDKHITIYNPREKWTVVDGIHPAIIDEDTFYRAQEILKGRYHPPSFNGTVKNPLSGLVYCAHCGDAMQRQVIRKGGEYLFCPKKGCMVSSSLPLVEKAVLDFLRAYVVAIDAAGQKEADDPQETMHYKEALEGIEADRATVNRQLAKLHDLLEQEVYTIDDFMARREALRQKLEKLANSQEIIEKKIRASRKPNLKKLRDMICSLLAAYGTAEPQQRNLLLKGVITKIIYRKEKGAPPDGFTLDFELKML